MSKGRKRPGASVKNEAPIDVSKPVHEQFLDLAKKGFKDPAALNADEVWHLCRALIFYSPQIG